MPLTCSSTPVCLGAVLSAHSCPRSLLPRETERSLNFASACRSSCEALSSSFASSSPSVLFAILLPHRRIYPILYPPMYLRRPLSPAVMFTPSLRLSSLSTSSSSRASFRIFAAILSRTNSLPFPSFVSPSAFFLSLPASDSHRRSSLLHFFVFVFCHLPSLRYRCFGLSSVLRRLFNLLRFISSKDRSDPPMI